MIIREGELKTVTEEIEALNSFEGVMETLNGSEIQREILLKFLYY
jgi:hypothetical protein